MPRAFRTPPPAGEVGRFVGGFLFDARLSEVESLVEGVFRLVENVNNRVNMTQKRQSFLARAFGARTECI